MRGKTLATIAAVLWGWGTFIAGCASHGPPQPETLRGLQDVRVDIEPLDPAIEQQSLTRSQVHREVAEALRKAGLPVLSIEEWDTPSHVPYLEVRVSLRKTDLDLYRYSLAARIVQETTQLPALKSIAAMVYMGEVGTFPPESVQAIRSSIGAMVSRFIQTQRSVKTTPDTP
jgi:hypothetical protein